MKKRKTQWEEMEQASETDMAKKKKRNRYGRNITIIKQKLSNYGQYVIMSSSG